MATVEICSYQRLLVWPACKFSYVIGRRAGLEFVGSCMWTQHDVFLITMWGARELLANNQVIATAFTCDRSWANCSSRNQEHPTPTSLTDGPGLWLHSICHMAFVGGSCFSFPSRSPRSYGCSMGLLTQYILPLLSQHLPDLEQQSLDVGSMLVDVDMCRRGKTRWQILDANRSSPDVIEDLLAPALKQKLSWGHWCSFWFLLPMLTPVRVPVLAPSLPEFSTSLLLCAQWRPVSASDGVGSADRQSGLVSAKITGRERKHQVSLWRKWWHPVTTCPLGNKCAYPGGSEAQDFHRWGLGLSPPCSPSKVPWLCFCAQDIFIPMCRPR